jgi:hypothetical protein
MDIASFAPYYITNHIENEYPLYKIGLSKRKLLYKILKHAFYLE